MAAIRIIHVELQPNPSRDIARLDISLNRAADIVIEIINVEGNKINSYSMSGTDKYKKLLTVDHLKTGIYIIVIKTCDDKEVMQLQVH